MGIVEKTAVTLPNLLAGGDSVDSLYRDLREGYESDKAAVADEEHLKNLRDRWLGRKNGLLAATNDFWLKAAPNELKRDVGRLQNETRAHIEASLAELKEQIEGAVAEGEALDVTLPGPARIVGARHPVRMVLEEMLYIFRGLGYSVAEGPEIENFYYNFEALGFPKDHPAVDEMDTIFVTEQMLLRTHTSPIQVRIMESHQPPLRYVVAGKVYRHDAPDSTHSPMFNQLELFSVGQNITFRDLKGTLDHFLKKFFGPEIKTRFRPSFFPFTEPSAEGDITCICCAGRGCRICKQTGLIEVLGCGMIDPEVFRHVGYDPDVYSGFAAGLGLDRFALLKYDIDDIQLLFQGDVRFLRQFR